MARVSVLQTVVFFVLLSLGVEENLSGQVPKLETAEECRQWFLTNWGAVEQKFACMGEAYVSSNTESAFVVKEWFEIKFVESSSQKSFHFLVCRQTYENGVQANRWEKSLKRDREYFRCAGDYYDRLEKVDINGFTCDGTPAVDSKEMVMPNVFVFAAQSGTAIYGNGNLASASKFFGDAKILESQLIEGKGMTGFFGWKNVGTEFVFDANSDWMPVFSRSFFRSTLKGEMNRDSYGKVHHEAKTKWEKLGKNLTVPVSVVSTVHRLNPVSKTSINIELKAVWAVDGIDKEMFSEKSLNGFYEDEGPLFKIQSDLRDRFHSIPPITK